MDLRLVVGGLLARNPVLSTLLLNYADRLRPGFSAPGGTTTATCFIVPTWTVDHRPSAPLTSELLTVEAHTSREDPDGPRELDLVLALLHAVLTDDHASRSITARRLGAAADLVAGGSDTVGKVDVWEITPTASCDLGAGQLRLLPWPDCSATSTTGFLASGTASMN